MYLLLSSPQSSNLTLNIKCSIPGKVIGIIMLSTTKPCNNNNVRTIDKSYKNNVICFVNGLFFNQLLNNVWFLGYKYSIP